MTITKSIYFFSLSYLIYGVLFSKSQQRRLLALIILLLNFAILFLCFHYEYMAFLLIIVYIGAISVLFLFVIMLVTLNQLSLTNRNFFVIFSLVFIFLFLILCSFCHSELQLDYNVVQFNFFKNYVNLNFMFWHNRPKILNELLYSNFSNLAITDFNEIYSLTYSCFTNFSLFNSFMPNAEIEQLGLIFWSGFSLVIFLSAIILVTSIVGSVAILKGMFSFNLLQRQIVSFHNNDKNYIFNSKI